jgi:hypothetical protein
MGHGQSDSRRALTECAASLRRFITGLDRQPEANRKSEAEGNGTHFRYAYPFAITAWLLSRAASMEQ